MYTHTKYKKKFKMLERLKNQKIKNVRKNEEIERG